MRTRIVLPGACLALLLSGCIALTATPPPKSTPTAADTPPATETPAESQTPPLPLDVALPDGWKRDDADGVTTVTGPEPGLRVAIVVAGDIDAKDAAIAAWKRVSPQFTDAPKDVVSPPTAPEPYEKTHVFDYQVDATQVIHQAVVHRYKGRMIAVLLEGPLAAAKKRAAQLREVVWGVRPEEAKPKVLTSGDAVALNAGQIAELEAFIEKARVKLQVPGVAFALTQRGKVVSAMGGGHTSLDKRTPITPKTHMMIGSITKSFTGLLLARLVAQGKFGWDTPVTKVYPDFRLKSPKQTAAMQMQHLMCACTGVPRRDLPILFEWERQKPAQTLTSLRNYELLTGFGETFQYSNQLVAAAGLIAGISAGGARNPLRGYRKLLRREVLDPLDMKDTHLIFGAIRKEGRHAYPHSETISGEIVPVNVKHERFVRPYAPAGALWTTAEDFAKLLVALTSKEGGGLPPRAQVAELWKPRVKVAAEATYGLGWMSAKYKGVDVHGHSGGTLGFISSFGYVPAAEAGFVLLTNGTRGGALKSVVRSKVLAMLFGQNDESAKKLEFIADLVEKQLLRTKKDVGEAVDEARIQALVGTYDGGELGVVRVRKKGDRVVLDTGPFKMAFLPKKNGPHKEMYVIAEPPLTGISFWVEEKDGKPQILLEPNSVRYVLKKR